MQDPFEEQQRLMARVVWALRNFHIVLAGSAGILFVVQFALTSILS